MIQRLFDIIFWTIWSALMLISVGLIIGSILFKFTQLGDWLGCKIAEWIYPELLGVM